MAVFTEVFSDSTGLIQDLARRAWRSYAGILSEEQIEYMLSVMYSSEELNKQFENPNFRYFIIYDQAPVGFIGVEFRHDTKTTKLHRLYLVPEAKRKNFGKDALNFVKAKADENGDSKIILNVNKNNPALHFYGSQGFKIYGEGIFDIGDGFVMDDYLMEFVIN